MSVNYQYETKSIKEYRNLLSLLKEKGFNGSIDFMLDNEEWYKYLIISTDENYVGGNPFPDNTMYENLTLSDLYSLIGYDDKYPYYGKFKYDEEFVVYFTGSRTGTVAACKKNDKRNYIGELRKDWVEGSFIRVDNYKEKDKEKTPEKGDFIIATIDKRTKKVDFKIDLGIFSNEDLAIDEIKKLITIDSEIKFAILEVKNICNNVIFEWE